MAARRSVKHFVQFAAILSGLAERYVVQYCYLQLLVSSDPSKANIPGEFGAKGDFRRRRVVCRAWVAAGICSGISAE